MHQWSRSFGHGFAPMKDVDIVLGSGRVLRTNGAGLRVQFHTNEDLGSQPNLRVHSTYHRISSLTFLDGGVRNFLAKEKDICGKLICIR